MEKITGNPYTSRFDPDKLRQKILDDRDIQNFIKKQGLTGHQIELSLTKFNQFCRERNRFRGGDEAYLAKGYEPILIMNEGYADVSYQETKEHHEAMKQQAKKDRIQLVNLPSAYKNLTLHDLLADDVRREETLNALVDFVETYPREKKGAYPRGLYLYGDMGIGKSFMMAALAGTLSQIRNAQTLMIHFPSFAIDIRHAIQDGKVKEEIDRIKTSEVLILDDIGAEQTSSWVRDEVLQVILQHRMLENLPTFFTSNYSMEDLATKLSSGRAEGEIWESKRVLERIRYLSREIYLEGENRR